MNFHAVFIRIRRAPLPVIAALWMTIPAWAHAGPGLFGTVAFKTAHSMPDGWLRVMSGRGRSIFVDERRFNASTRWKDLRLRAEGRPLPEVLRLVNTFWNRWPYRTDQEAYGERDHWASPEEFLARSGDCEDYCIVKYYTLKALGVPVDHMRIVVVRDVQRGVDHAILAVKDVGGGFHILDSLGGDVLPADMVRRYEPRISVNELHHWVHVKAR